MSGKPREGDRNMIESSVLKVLERRTPNYHLVAEKFAKQTFSLCCCAKCQDSELMKVKGECVHLVCQRVYERLKEIGAEGHAIVSELGTCDAARFCKEDYSRFRLEAEE